MKFVAITPDFHFYAQTLSPAWFVMFAYLYWFIEAKYFVAMPLLNIFYRRITNM
jgi:hypothetical protein